MSLLAILDRVSDVAAFDKVIEPARRAVQAALRPQGLKDLLHGTWLGHPLHPVLVQVPVGSWLSAGLLDTVPRFRPAATFLIGTGVATAVPAALSGAADWQQQDVGIAASTPLTAVAARSVDVTRSASCGSSWTRNALTVQSFQQSSSLIGSRTSDVNRANVSGLPCSSLRATIECFLKALAMYCTTGVVASGGSDDEQDVVMSPAATIETKRREVTRWGRV